ncbi:MAG: hypothetical protein EOO07_12010 [Chitinophagaceae bacterium]|nr:MAG: hypothetical protein EOO07_12010 [Chitinophagaceae bacterium]
MNLKDLPVVLFQHELTKARLKIAELAARTAEIEIYESVCQNLVMVHFKLAALAILEKQNGNLDHLSGLILDSVRDLKKVSKKCYAAENIENESQLMDLLKDANQVLKLGISDIRVEGMFGRLTNTDFLYFFLTLHNLLVLIASHKRKLDSICVHGSDEGARCIIEYSGLPINMGRLTSNASSGSSSLKENNFKLLKRFAGTVRSVRSVARKKSVQLMIPLLKDLHG